MQDNLSKKQQKQVEKAVDKQVKQAEKELKQEVKTQLETKVEKAVQQRLKDKLKNSTAYLGEQYRHHVSTAVIAAFGFLIALAWRDLITKLITHFTKVELLNKYPFIADFYSVIIITAVSVIGIIFVSKWAQKPKD